MSACRYVRFPGNRGRQTKRRPQDRAPAVPLSFCDLQEVSTLQSHFQVESTNHPYLINRISDPFLIDNVLKLNHWKSSPVALSSCMESLMPYHTATASALLMSMLSVSCRSSGWTHEGLKKLRSFLQQSFPNVGIVMAHGKKSFKELEYAMEKFSRDDVKILLSTNIVESGFNIQNANTISVQDVQLFGLAQIYQLRERVRRADKKAYAYLFYDEDVLSDQAMVCDVFLDICVL